MLPFRKFYWKHKCWKPQTTNVENGETFTWKKHGLLFDSNHAESFNYFHSDHVIRSKSKRMHLSRENYLISNSCGHFDQLEINEIGCLTFQKWPWPSANNLESRDSIPEVLYVFRNDLNRQKKVVNFKRSYLKNKSKLELHSHPQPRIKSSLESPGLASAAPDFKWI